MSRAPNKGGNNRYGRLPSVSSGMGKNALGGGLDPEPDRRFQTTSLPELLWRKGGKEIKERSKENEEESLCARTVSSLELPSLRRRSLTPEETPKPPRPRSTDPVIMQKLPPVVQRLSSSKVKKMSRREKLLTKLVDKSRRKPSEVDTVFTSLLPLLFQSDDADRAIVDEIMRICSDSVTSQLSQAEAVPGWMVRQRNDLLDYHNKELVNKNNQILTLDSYINQNAKLMEENCHTEVDMLLANLNGISSDLQQSAKTHYLTTEANERANEWFKLKEKAMLEIDCIVEGGQSLGIRGSVLQDKFREAVDTTMSSQKTKKVERVFKKQLSMLSKDVIRLVREQKKKVKEEAKPDEGIMADRTDDEVRASFRRVVLNSSRRIDQFSFEAGLAQDDDVSSAVNPQETVDLQPITEEQEQLEDEQDNEVFRKKAEDPLPPDRRAYVDACERLCIAPAPVFIAGSTETLLDMKHYSMGDAGATAVAEALRINTTIQSLNLSWNNISEVGLKQLVSALEGDPSRIKHLDISNNPVGRRAGTILSDYLQKTLELTELSLGCCELGDRGCRDICLVLPNNDSVVKLDLSGNNVGSGGIDALASVLAELPYLQDLNLSWNHIRGKAARELGAALHNNVMLQKLDLSWNGFGTEGALLICQSLTGNESLTSLDLSYNHVGAEAAGTFSEQLANNKTIRSLQLNGNPLGLAGARALLRVCMDSLDENNEPVNLGIQDVHFEETSCLFDITNPAGTYVLDLHEPYHAYIARQLFQLHQKHAPDDPIITLATLNGTRVSVSSWSDVPLKGLLEITAVGSPPLSNLEAMPENKFNHLWDLVKRTRDVTLGNAKNKSEKRTKTSKQHIQLLNIVAESVRFTAQQAIHLLSLIDSSRERLSVATSLMARLAEGENVQEILATIPKKDADVLRKTLGSFYDFDETNPSNHYVINVAVPAQRLFFQKLREISNKERLWRRANNQPDTSQSSNGDGLRNETLNGVPVVLGSGSNIPESGVIEFDFVSFTRPTETEPTISEEDFPCWLPNAFEGDAPFAKELKSLPVLVAAKPRRWGEASMSSTMRDAAFPSLSLSQKFNASTRDLLGSSHRTVELSVDDEHVEELSAPPSPTAQEISLDHALFPCKTPQILTAEDALSRSAEEDNDDDDALVARSQMVFCDADRPRWAVVDELLKKRYVFTASQAVAIASLFADEQSRVFVMVRLFGRIVDLENFFIMMVSKDFGFAEISQVAHRLGWLNIFNPFHADVFRFVLDLSKRDDWEVTCVMVQLAVGEPGENWDGETYNGNVFELPVSWITDVPRSGILEVTYVTANRDRGLLVDLRCQLSRRYLFSSKFPDDASLKRYLRDYYLAHPELFPIELNTWPSYEPVFGEIVKRNREDAEEDAPVVDFADPNASAEG